MGKQHRKKMSTKPTDRELYELARKAGWSSEQAWPYVIKVDDDGQKVIIMDLHEMEWREPQMTSTMTTVWHFLQACVQESNKVKAITLQFKDTQGKCPLCDEVILRT